MASRMAPGYCPHTWCILNTATCLSDIAADKSSVYQPKNVYRPEKKLATTLSQCMMDFIMLASQIHAVLVSVGVFRLITQLHQSPPPFPGLARTVGFPEGSETGLQMSQTEICLCPSKETRSSGEYCSVFLTVSE